MYILLELYILFSILFFFFFSISYCYSLKLKLPNLDNNLFALSFIIFLNSLYLCLNNTFTDLSLFNNLLLKDGSTNVICLFIITINLFVIVLTRYYNKTLFIPSFEFQLLILFITFNSLFLISVNNLFLFFLLLEVLSISLFILSAINRRSRYSIESSLKYFVLGSFSSILMLLGISLVYISTSLMFLDDLSILFSSLNYSVLFSTGINLALIFISIGFFFKLYSAPFHFWVSDIYQGSATSSVFLFATSSSFIFFYLFIKLFFTTFYPFFSFFNYYFIIFSLLSMFFGCIGGLIQNRIKKILAYSSITSIGYLILVLFSCSTSSIESAFLFIISYIITAIGIFTILCSILLKNKSFLNFSVQLTNISTSNRLMSFSLASFLFSMGGIPPFFGFIAKFELIGSLLTSKLFYLFFIFLLISTISFLYYLRILKWIYTKNNNTSVLFEELNYTTSLVISFILLGITLSSIFNSSLFLFSKLVSICLLTS